MNIGFLQFLPVDDYAINIRYLLNKLVNIKDTLIVLPEFFLTSYIKYKPFQSHKMKLYLNELLNLSYVNSLGLVGSLPVSNNEKIYNRCLYINNGEIIGKYDKTCLYKAEKNTCYPGKDNIGIFDYKGIKFGVQICLDIINSMPLSKAVKKHDIDFLLVPAAISVDFLLTIAKARALENQIITILANRSRGISKEQIEYLGKSAIYYPDGTKVQVISNAQTLKIISVGKDELMKIRQKRKSLIY